INNPLAFALDDTKLSHSHQERKIRFIVSNFLGNTEVTRLFSVEADSTVHAVVEHILAFRIEVPIDLTSTEGTAQELVRHHHGFSQLDTVVSFLDKALGQARPGRDHLCLDVGILPSGSDAIHLIKASQIPIALDVDLVPC